MPVLGLRASAALTLGKGVGWEVRVSVSLRAEEPGRLQSMGLQRVRHD